MMPTALLLSPAQQQRVSSFLSQAKERARQPSAQERWPFEIDGDVVGSVLPTDAQALDAAFPSLILADDTLSLAPVCSPDAPAVLNSIAQWFAQQGRIKSWRNENLRVNGDSGQTRGVIERGAVRLLGIETFSVNLLAYNAHGFWVQQRAANKAVDPGLWDPTASGLVADLEEFGLALQREAQEEAGLDLAALANRGLFTERFEGLRMTRPVPEGFMRETAMHWSIRLPDDLTPINMDGEVDQFACWTPEEIICGVEQGLFTLEATLCLGLFFQHCKT